MGGLSPPRAQGRRRTLIWLVGVLPAVAVLAGLVYSVAVYRRSGIAEQGLTVCEGAKCVWTHHVHADVEGSIFGEELRLPLETGSTERVHTHKERNRLHWHGRLEFPYCPAKSFESCAGRGFDFPSNLAHPLNLGGSLHALGFLLTDTCLQKLPGYTCRGEPGTLRFTVNGVDTPDPDGYVWRDGDRLRLTFE